MNPETPYGSSKADCLPEDKPAPRPEDFIGTTVESDGVSRRVESIEAFGSKFVVFKLRNLTTGQFDQVLKVLREEFDPRTPLLKALRDALHDLSRNPDRIVRICDRLLTIDATNEAAAFDKGVALLVKGETNAALEAFNLAVTLRPTDLLNLVHRAACFASLERDDESLRDLQTAAEVDAGQLKKTLVIVPRHAVDIRQALRRLSKTASKSKEARQALRANFGAIMQLRLLFSRLNFWRRRKASSG